MSTIAKVTLEDGMKFVGETGSGHILVMDAAEKVGGRNAGPRPAELPFAGLAGCTGMDTISILRKMRQVPDRFSIEVEGLERREEHPKHWLSIRVTFTVDGEVAEDRLARAIELSRTTYCSVSASLRDAMQIEYVYVLNGKRVVL